mmetsp:Transcript_27694/g.51627  ORF Transcript_27694/g.51627 Transcript_27694/m.51627 type:complete len:81 (-) Transcript_27694:451-693(-)
MKKKAGNREDQEKTPSRLRERSKIAAAHPLFIQTITIKRTSKRMRYDTCKISKLSQGDERPFLTFKLRRLISAIYQRSVQ